MARVQIELKARVVLHDLATAEREATSTVEIQSFSSGDATGAAGSPMVRPSTATLSLCEEAPRSLQFLASAAAAFATIFDIPYRRHSYPHHHPSIGGVDANTSASSLLSHATTVDPVADLRSWAIAKAALRGGQTGRCAGAVRAVHATLLSQRPINPLPVRIVIEKTTT